MSAKGEKLNLAFEYNKRNPRLHHFTNITRTCFGLNSGKMEMCFIKIQET